MFFINHIFKNHLPQQPPAGLVPGAHLLLSFAQAFWDLLQVQVLQLHLQSLHPPDFLQVSQLHWHLPSLPQVAAQGQVFWQALQVHLQSLQPPTFLQASQLHWHLPVLSQVFAQQQVCCPPDAHIFWSELFTFSDSQPVSTTALADATTATNSIVFSHFIFILLIKPGFEKRQHIIALCPGFFKKMQYFLKNPCFFVKFG